ncbi:MAG: hypothetical protein ACOCZ8_04715 [Bacteroidota bacterium]
MGTRMTRFRGKQLNAAALQPLEGAWVEVLLHDGETFAGRLLKAESAGLLIEDPNRAWYNTRYHQHSLAYKDIAEVLLTAREAF